jgi:hypothetical protein
VKRYPHGFWEDGNSKYSVDLLFESVEDREPSVVSIDGIIRKNKNLGTGEGNFYDNIENPNRKFKKRAQKTDTTYPVLLSREGWIIDGSHRIAKLKWMGETQVKAHILSRSDLKGAEVSLDEGLVLSFSDWKNIVE